MGPVTDAYVIETTFRRWGLRPKKNGRRWNSPCPFCQDGEDRFVIFQRDGGWWCHFCGRTGWLDDDKTKSRLSLKELAAISKKHAEAEARLRQSKLSKWQRSFDTSLIYKWHDEMSDAHRKYWLDSGINDGLVDKFLLGYNDNKAVKFDGSDIVLAAYSIPILSPFTGKLHNIEWRIEKPYPGMGKYRQEFDVPAANFYPMAYDEDEAPRRRCLIVEGAKKSIVLADWMSYTDYVCGLPGVSPHTDCIDEIGVHFKGRKYLILDPAPPKERAKQVARFTERLTDLYVVTMFAKPDDAIIHNYMSKRIFEMYLDGARKVS